MTKDEALKLALEAMTYADACLKKQLTMKYKHEYAQDLLLEAGTAIKEALAQPEPNYKKALEVWLDKTEWVQETVKPHELGMHRADVLNQRIEAALAQQEQDWIERERAVGYREGHRAALAQRTWVGLTDEERKDTLQSVNTGFVVDASVVALAIEAKLKEKNT